ncbi:MAG: hypothetical protein JWN03_3214 [Nocardia sp.]|nr:hypothetical protein [Nocardia sp.]
MCGWRRVERPAKTASEDPKYPLMISVPDNPEIPGVGAVVHNWSTKRDRSGAETAPDLVGLTGFEPATT